MSREDESLPDYAFGEVDLVELGLDHDGKPQWYMSTREGWVEIGNRETGVISLSPESNEIGTRIELRSPVEKFP